MSELRRRLEEGPVLLLDGGLGSACIARGLPAGAAPDLWNLERPEEILAIHRGYVEAGSEAIHANTFGANGARLRRFQAADRSREINLAAVRLAREAKPRFVIGDVGPTGEYLPPVGRGNAVEWRQHFLRQGEVLSEAGVDALHVETMSDVREALLALEALREAAPGIPLLVSLTFDRKKRGFTTVMGDPLVPSLVRLAEAGAVAVGANCSITSADMRDLAREALLAPGLRLVVQPNAGAPQLTSAGVRYAQKAEEFAGDLFGILSSENAPGASRLAALGGCCGTDASFIAALRARMTGNP